MPPEYMPALLDPIVEGKRIMQKEIACLTPNIGKKCQNLGALAHFF